MSISQYIQLDDDHTWGIGYDVMGPGQFVRDCSLCAIIIPINQFADMSGDSIKEELESLVIHARRLKAASAAYDYLWNIVRDKRKLDDDQLAHWDEVITPFATEEMAPNRNIIEAARHIAEEKQRRIDKAAKKPIVKRRRRAYNAKRDQLMLALIERDGYQCATCGTSDNITIDHITPLSRGGSDDLDNLQLLCQSCNSKKSDTL